MKYVDRRNEGGKFTRIYQRAKYSIGKTSIAKKLGNAFGFSTSKQSKTAESMAISRLAGGLDKVLRLAVGGRIMLKRNVNPRLGLVNGATGFIHILYCFVRINIF